MLKKQNSPLTSIHRKKTPKEAYEHLEFSLTSGAVSGEDYARLKQERTYAGRKAAAAETGFKTSFWAVFKDELESAKTGTSVFSSVEKPTKTARPDVRVKKGDHQRSPYVVRLERKSAVLPLAPISKSSARSFSWFKRRNRSLSAAKAEYRLKVKKAGIDFLGKKSGPALFGNGGAGLKKVFTAVSRWLFEFVLSIPLGVLLFLQLLIKLVEIFSNLGIRSASLAARIVSTVVEQTLVAVVALGRGAIAIPIKIAVILVLGVYRLGGVFAKTLAAAARHTRDFSVGVIQTFRFRPPRFAARLLAFSLLAALSLGSVLAAGTAPQEAEKVGGRVLGATREGFQLLGMAGSENAAQAASWESATLKFEEAQSSLDSMNVLLRGLVGLTREGASGAKIIKAGEDLSRAGAALAQGFAPFLAEADSTLETKQNTITILRQLETSLAAAQPYLASARDNLAGVDESVVPDEYRAKFAAARAILPQIYAAAAEFSSLSGTLISVLGGDMPRRYLVLFQNNNELRPAGGFIGSLAILEVNDGKISSLNIPGGGAYDFQGYLTAQVASPKPLALVNPHWQLHDSNWYPDWPTSAEKAAWFLEHAGYSSPDGVVAIQATTFEKLLAILGPIEFPEYGEILTSENVLFEIQKAVELEYDKEENKPKQYIAELAPRVIEKILASDPSQLLALLDLLGGEIEEKNLLVYFRDQGINSVFADRGWQPSILPSERDYLSVVHANIGGGKTDGVIEESWQQEITIDADGSALARLTVIRRHNGAPDHVFEGWNNVDYARVYVPAGSELVSASGFKPPPADLFEVPGAVYREDAELASIEGKILIDEASGTRINNEFGKTVFGNWIQVEPGGTALAHFTYKLPFKVKPRDILNLAADSSGYSLIVQKQPGARPVRLSLILRYPPEWGIKWQKTAAGGTITQGLAGTAVFESILNKDTGFALLFDQDASD